MTDVSMSPLVRHDPGTSVGGGPAVADTTGWLALAATPTFALMALWTGLFGGPPDMLCVHEASPLSGMRAMYLLMSVFHAAPWLRLIAGRS